MQGGAPGEEGTGDRRTQAYCFRLCTTDVPGNERFKVMEYRLFKQIMNPAMIATWIFGIILVLTPGVLNAAVTDATPRSEAL